jgi:cob(I)alamin adenosyltransferase
MEMVKPKLEKGLIQVYTGNGKGKTSAAFGLALRAIGDGLKVFVIQFIKGGFDYGELHAVKSLPNLELRAFGRGQFISQKPPDREDVKLAREGFELAKKVIEEGDFDIVVLDEINVAMHLKLIRVNEVLDLIRNKPKHVELVLTGRNAPSEIVEIADLVTEMKEIKHPYALGVQPRKGIEY